MKQTSEVERDDNVIKLSFKQDYDPDLIPHDVAHPASKNFAADDPLHELLHEFDELVDEHEDDSHEKEEFIFHHQRPWDYQVHYDDDLRLMADTIMDQIKRLKEDAKRLKYYLDEMDIDQNIMKYTEFYQEVSQFVDIPEKHWEYVETLLRETYYPKGSILLKSGEESDRFFINLEGLLRIYYQNNKGQEFTKTFIGQHEIATPYSEMLQGLPSRVNIEALVDSRVLVLKYDDLKALMKDSANWVNLKNKYTEKYFIFREQREYERLVLDLKDRFDIFKQKYPELINSIPQYHIASYLGVTPVTLSRMLSKK